MSSVSEIFDRWQIQKSEYAVYAGFDESLFLLGLQSTADLISNKHRVHNELALVTWPDLIQILSQISTTASG